MSVALAHGAGGWTVADVLALPPSNDRHELVDGFLIVSAWANVPHQRASTNLLHVLADAIDARGPGLTVLPTVNVEVPSGLLVPDLVAADSSVLQEPDLVAIPAGAVSLVVEIVSPSSRRMDRLVKPTLYAEAGIEHYWRLELDPPELVAYRLEGDTYAEVARIADATPGTLEQPFPITLDVRSVLR